MGEGVEWRRGPVTPILTFPRQGGRDFGWTLQIQTGGMKVALVRLDITNREPFADGQSFGDAGPYRLLEGDAHFAVAPLHPRNEAITDLELASRDDDGNVRFSAHFAMLQPADPERGNSPHPVRRAEPGAQNGALRTQQQRPGH